MARVLPSGRVFGEVHRLPNIQYAKGDDAFGRLEKLSESNLASIAVAGIDRIRKELALNAAEEAEAQRLAETRRKLEELKREGAAWEAHAAREAEGRQAAQAPTFAVPAAPAAAPSGQLFPGTRVERGQLQPRAQAAAAHIEYNAPRVARRGEMVRRDDETALQAGQRLIAEAHRRLAAKGLGPDDLGPSIRSGKYGIGPQTRAELELMVQDASQQPQAVVAEESIYAPAREQRLADINEQMAALQKQMQPMPTPRTGAEFIYAVMQETDPRRRAALLYQARNAIGDSPATIQEAFSGAATMRMQEKMLKGMSLADAAALAAKEFNVKEDELKVKQRTVAAKEKREANYAKRVEAENKLTQARVNKLEREEREASRKAARATGASRRAHEKRAAIARVIRMHHTKQLDYVRATSEIYTIPGISRGEITNAVAIITKKREAWDKLAAEEAKAAAAIEAADVAYERQLERDVATEDHEMRMAAARAASKQALEVEKRAVRKAADKLDAELSAIAKEVETIERNMGALDRVRSEHPHAFEKASRLSKEDYEDGKAASTVLDRWPEAQRYKNLADKLGVKREEQRRKIEEMDARRVEEGRIDADLNALQKVLTFGDPTNAGN